MKIKDNYEIVKIDDEIIAVPVGVDSVDKQLIIKMNGSAAYVFELLQEDISEEDIFLKLEESYQVNSETFREDIHSFIKELIETGIIE